MGKVIAENVKQGLGDIVGDGYLRTDRRECKAYSFDIGVMPPLVKPLVPAGVAAGVVRPGDEGQLQRIVRYAAAKGLKLVPRAGGSSGYGGALPGKGALVVAMTLFDRVLNIDAERLVVTAQAGAIWEEVDREIGKQGLQLRLHPSSYPSSTVGGWLAQGGSGFGSYEFGTFKENVLSARVVQADGSIKEFTGDELLSYVADAEGITGIITEVSFRVRRLELQREALIAFSDAGSISHAMQAMLEQKLPLWSVTFFNPEAVRLKKQLPLRHCHDFERQELLAHQAMEAALPENYLLLAAWPEGRTADIDEPLATIVAANGGSFLPEKDARFEWESHTAPMRLKRIGPSIIPTEVIVPIDGLSASLDEIDQKIRQRFILEGMLGTDGSVVLLGFIPHDERSFGFNVAFALSLYVIRIAERHGGSAYSTGLYFRRQAERVLGKERLRRLRQHKQRVDPQSILNPGKVFASRGSGGRLLDVLMGMASNLEALIRPVANVFKQPRNPRISGPDKRGVPSDVAFMATACSRCGYCVSTCEQYSGRGWESQSPRGKYAWLREVAGGREKWDRAAVDTFLMCTTCERCDLRCQLQLPVEHNWMQMRGKLVNEQKRGTFPPFEMMAASLQGEGDIWAGKREHRADWVPADVLPRIKERAEILYFAGCTASYVETDIAEATLRLLIDSGYDVTYLGTEENCCAIPMRMSGKWDVFSEVFRKNYELAKERGVKTVVTSCPACALVWKELYAEEAARLDLPYDIESKHYSELIAPALASGKLQLKRDPFEGHRVTFHDSCHAGRAQGIYDPPREMLRAIPGIDYREMEHCREEGVCCGSVLTLVGEINTAPILGGARLAEATDIEATTVIAACPCCQVQLRDSADKNSLPLVIDDLARVTAVAAGYDIASSQAHTSYMWGLFDIFIRLMEPRAMADFMVVLFPRMTSEMPFGMGRLMRPMARLPFGPALMRWMMPWLFPRLAPGIMARVMDDMLVEVGTVMGELPPDMEALLPQLLPQTLNAIMPTYLPQLVPHLVPKFIGYLRDGKVVDDVAR
jgi:Fe-S oxidoreductase/FAD/FMN-containing dehydrogenase